MLYLILYLENLEKKKFLYVSNWVYRAINFNYIITYKKINKTKPLISFHLNSNKNYLLGILTGKTVYNKFSEFNIYKLWYIIYQQQYLSSIFKFPLIFKTFNARQIVPKSIIYFITHSVRSVKWKKYYIIHSNEVIEILFLCLWLKNLKLFMNWMRKYFEKTNLKKHKKLFLLLNLLLGSIVWNYNIFLQLKGLRLSLRGKFGKAGSVRKTRKYIKRGKCSYTSKNIALVSQNNIIRTLTGVFSIKFEVFF